MTISLIIYKLNYEIAMEKDFKRKLEFESSALSKGNNKDLKQNQIEINLDDLLADPRLLTQILDYNPNVRVQIQRAYLQKGPRASKI